MLISNMIISTFVAIFITTNYLTIARFSFENINYENELAVNRSKASQASGRIVGGKKVGVPRRISISCAMASGIGFD